MTRPALPKLKRGDSLVMVTGHAVRRQGTDPVDVRVIAVGPKYVHVVAEKYFGQPGETERNFSRRFLLADQKEGAPGTRYGDSPYVVTSEQHAYDKRLRDTYAYLRETVGIDIRHGSPLADPEIALRVAVMLTEAEFPWSS